ncbi:hypothetical protein niasHS_008084 [Heterodera schachtii]|uniref:Uncharacterized protein n=1 Tax=Heterodera schachtii TaxID=97005 RepID=A0ABD2J7L3_HETSC
MTERTWPTSTNNCVEKQMTKSRNCRRSSMRPSILSRDLAVKREAEEHLMKMEEGDNCKREGRNETESVSRIAFKGAGGERAEAERPTYFHIFRGEVQLATETVARADYEPKGRCDRFPDKKHAEAELLRRDGTIRAEGTVNRSDYANDGKRGERHEISWPDLDPIQHHANNIHRAEFVAHESGKRKVPTEEGAEHTPAKRFMATATTKNALNHRHQRRSQSKLYCPNV